MRDRLDARGWVNVAVCGAALAGLGLRIWMAVSPLGTLDSDEAVWGMMAQRTLHGHPAIFFWHQAYGGTQEVFALAAVFAVTGPSVAAMRAFQVVLYAVAAVLVWRIGLRTVGEPAARIAAALFWIWPAYLVWRSTREYGFYGSALVLSLLAVLLVLRLRAEASWLNAALLGLVGGLGLWATPQVAFVALPAVAWLVWRSPRVVRLAPAAIAGLLAGGAPWLVWNLRHGWRSFQTLPAGEHNGYVQRLGEYVATTLPQILGLRIPWSLHWIANAELAGRGLTVLLLAGLVWLAIRQRGRPVEPIVAIAVGFPFLYALSPYDWLIVEPRYVSLIAPIAALLLAYAAVAVRLGPVLVAAALALTLAGLVPMERDLLALPTEDTKRVSTHLGPALRALNAARVTRVRAPYWTAYRIEFATGGRVLVQPVTNAVRDDVAAAAVQRDPHPAWVFQSNQPDNAKHAPGLLRAGYRREVAGDWSVYLWPRAAR